MAANLNLLHHRLGDHKLNRIVFERTHIEHPYTSASVYTRLCQFYYA